MGILNTTTHRPSNKFLIIFIKHEGTIAHFVNQHTTTFNN